MSNQEINTPDRLIRLPEVTQLVGFKRSSIYAMAHTGTFPRPVKIGKRQVAWSERAVRAWITSRLQGAA